MAQLHRFAEKMCLESKLNTNNIITQSFLMLSKGKYRHTCMYNSNRFGRNESKPPINANLRFFRLRSNAFFLTSKHGRPGKYFSVENNRKPRDRETHKVNRIQDFLICNVIDMHRKSILFLRFPTLFEGSTDDSMGCGVE